MEHAAPTSLAEVQGREGQARYRHGTDPHAWALKWAELLSKGRFDQLDTPNLADEMTDLARREYGALESDLARVIQHLLTWDGREAALAEAFRRGRAEALVETDLPSEAFPSAGTPTWDDVMTRPVAWPVS